MEAQSVTEKCEFRPELPNKGKLYLSTNHARMIRIVYSICIHTVHTCKYIYMFISAIDTLSKIINRNYPNMTFNIGRPFNISDTLRL